MSIHERIPGDFPAGSRLPEAVHFPPLRSLAILASQQGCGLGWQFMKAAEANVGQRPLILKADPDGCLQRWEVGIW